MSRIGASIQTKYRFVFARALGGKKQLITKGLEGTFWGNRITLCFDCSGDFITSYICQMHRSVYLKRVNLHKKPDFKKIVNKEYRIPFSRFNI